MALFYFYNQKNKPQILSSEAVAEQQKEGKESGKQVPGKTGGPGPLSLKNPR